MNNFVEYLTAVDKENEDYLASLEGTDSIFLRGSND